MPQMTFAEIGTLYNLISNELEGGVTPQNQKMVLQQISTVQTQLQGLIKNGTFNNFVDGDGANATNTTIVHAQNIADQMTFLTKVVGTTYGTNTNAPPKYINDVIRDVQDIVAGDDNLANLAQQDGHSGFQQVSNLLVSPTPYPDSGQQSATLLKFIADSNSLGTAAKTAIADLNFDPHSAATMKLIGDIQAFSTAASDYSAAQGGVFSARFNNEFGTNGVQGTAARELVIGLQNHDAALVNGAASVLMANAGDVRTNMMTQTDMPATPLNNFGIPNNIQDVHTAGLVFNDAVTKLIGGVYGETTDANGINSPGNQKSIMADLAATKTGLQNVINAGGITDAELNDLKHAVSLLGQESALVNSINTANPTRITGVNGQINTLQSQILNTINNNPALATAAMGNDGTTGFIALPDDGLDDASPTPRTHTPITHHDLTANQDTIHQHQHIPHLHDHLV